MEIGGYFGLELRQGKEYHPEALKLNTGRNSFEFILRTNKVRKTYLPRYTCQSMLEPIRKLGLENEFYPINEQFEPRFDFSKVKQDEAFVYTNYYGLSDHIVSKLIGKCANLIIDNAQSFFSDPLEGTDTFYSARKFFGVPDGAYLFIHNASPGLIQDLPVNKTHDRFDHLLKRIELGARAGYSVYKENEKSLIGDSIKQMSTPTRLILGNIDYQFVAEKRRSNFKFLHHYLKEKNLLKLSYVAEAVPMVYPFLTNNTEVRSKLLEQEVYVATYWPNVLECSDPDSTEYNLAKNTLPLPVDQRYSEPEMKRIIEIIDNL
jgi:hypothetical protein